jgi:hypothetical protein
MGQVPIVSTFADRHLIGVTGVGSVTASEIVKQFPGKDGLKKFRDWVVNGIEYGLNDQSRAWFKKHVRLSWLLLAHVLVTNNYKHC